MLARQPNSRASHGSVGGRQPPPYVASAVHADGATFLSIASLTATDNDTFSCAFWFKVTLAGATWFVTDPQNAFTNTLQTGASSMTFEFDGSGSLIVGTTSPPSSGVWHCMVASFNTNTGVSKIYLDRVDVTDVLTDDSPFTLTSNGLPFDVFTGEASDTLTGDFADWRIAPGQSWLTTGDISAATLDLFQDAITLKPVDPAIATDALGAPRVLFSGDAATFGTNLGTGGAFTLTGAFTNASTSPSD